MCLPSVALLIRHSQLTMIILDNKLIENFELPLLSSRMGLLNLITNHADHAGLLLLIH